MVRLTMIVSSAILCTASFSSAQNVSPSFDCAKSDNEAESAICRNDGLAELDMELSRLYGLALRGPNVNKPRAEELKRSERDWVRDRRECWKASVGLETCVANAYAMRIHALREGYSDARANDGEGISLGPVAFRCEGLEALVSAVFVNGNLPMVSLQWLDRAMVLPGAASGSGGKYESDVWDGGSSTFWTKGEDAVFAPPGKAEMHCTLEPIG